uniref:Uncharacterized protein n=1 Tax=Arundo donax TaxID=35708 RepID=A0A0A9EL36_ARUDO
MQTTQINATTSCNHHAALRPCRRVEHQEPAESPVPLEALGGHACSLFSACTVSVIARAAGRYGGSAHAAWRRIAATFSTHAAESPPWRRNSTRTQPPSPTRPHAPPLRRDHRPAWRT